MGFACLRLIGCRLKANCPLMGPRPIGGLLSMGGLSKGSWQVFKRASEKTTENSERLSRQALPRFEPGTSRLPVLSVINPPLVGRHVFRSPIKVTFILLSNQKITLMKHSFLLRSTMCELGWAVIVSLIKYTRVLGL